MRDSRCLGTPNIGAPPRSERKHPDGGVLDEALEARVLPSVRG